MSRPRQRFCPHGHDKDAPGNSRWEQVLTLKGTSTGHRSCIPCHREIYQPKQRQRRRHP
jgi:hypothetical protein